VGKTQAPSAPSHDATNHPIARVEDVIPLPRQQLGGFRNTTKVRSKGLWVHVLVAQILGGKQIRSVGELGGSVNQLMAVWL
jgi:hypothetical protein